MPPNCPWTSPSTASSSLRCLPLTNFPVKVTIFCSSPPWFSSSARSPKYFFSRYWGRIQTVWCVSSRQVCDWSWRFPSPVCIKQNIPLPDPIVKVDHTGLMLAQRRLPLGDIENGIDDPLILMVEFIVMLNRSKMQWFISYFVHLPQAGISLAHLVFLLVDLAQPLSVSLVRYLLL